MVARGKGDPYSFLFLDRSMNKTFILMSNLYYPYFCVIVSFWIGVGCVTNRICQNDGVGLTPLCRIKSRGEETLHLQ